jgi:two-component system response regulator AtoC
MFTFQTGRPDDPLIGSSPAIQRVKDQIQRAALTEVPVLITGETGTGKELVAKLLHASSARRNQNFFQVNCLAITDQMLSGRSFQGEQPSPSAIAYPSLTFSEADKGTLFLDEIGELDLALQPMFLCALQNCQEVSLGSTVDRPINIRLICATNTDLEAEMARGRFRADLFHRINIVRIHMPALRERASDIPALMDYFLHKYSEPLGRRPLPLSTSFMRSLSNYHWPGNVRELENMAKRYVVLGEEDQALSAIRQADHVRSMVPMPFDLTTPLRVQTKRALQHLEKSIILGVLEAHRWNRRKTARSLDISYRTLLYKIKEVGLPQPASASRKLDSAPIHVLCENPLA